MVNKQSDKEEVGSRVRLLREALGIRQGVFAARIGVAPNLLANVEAGGNYPNPKLAATICSEFGVTMDWLFRGVRAGVSSDVAQRIVAFEAKAPTDSPQ